ncbi:hypothetical protein GGR58DRAFT_507965 [Xylaria digitata]|nr:hypothetical protein GGR58DRAFT_507965 [Xylaria digitata]
MNETLCQAALEYRADGIAVLRRDPQWAATGVSCFGAFYIDAFFVDAVCSHSPSSRTSLSYHIQPIQSRHQELTTHKHLLLRYRPIVTEPGITEIIWDEALLSQYDFDGDDDEHFRWRSGPAWVPRWFRDDCEEGLRVYMSGRSYEIETPERAARVQQARAHLPIEESWLHYHRLEEQEEDVIARGLDVWLEQVSIVKKSHHHARGTRAVVIDAHTPYTGLNCCIFDEPCEEYNNLVAIIQQPGFTRLQLDFAVDEQEHHGWPSFRSGLLCRALSKAVDLEDFRFGTNVEEDTGEGLMENHIPLLSIFPTDKWPRLEHFGLTRFIVTQTDVILLLASLPLTIRSVQMSFLYFLDGGGAWKTLLEEMRNTLGWWDRAEDARPAVSIGIDFVTSENRGRTIWVDKEAHDFLYNDGENPFG